MSTFNGQFHTMKSYEVSSRINIKRKKKMKNLPVEMTEIRSCMKFFDFLQERHGERYTKFEAYCYLLNKACVQYIPENFPKESRPHLAEYQFITTKTELSEVWHWHRATVRSFLDKLVECGQLIRKDYAKSIFCTMTALSSPESTHDLQMQLFDTMTAYTVSAWAIGSADTKQTAKVCEQIIISSMNLSVQVMPDEFYRTRNGLVREMSTRIISQLLTSFFHWKEEEIQLQRMKELMVELLIGHLESKWDVMLTLVKDLPAIASGKLSEPSFIDTELASVLLQKICDEYNCLCGKPATGVDAKESFVSSSVSRK